MDRKLSENLTDREHWLRLLIMLIFVLIYGVAELVVAAVILFQVGSMLITGGRNGRADDLGQRLATYVYEVIRFLTYTSDERPFPFGPWPDGPPKAEPLPPTDEYGEVVLEDEDGG